MQNCWVLLAIVPFSAASALADITNQSVNATLNGSASVTVRCDSCPGGVGGGSGSFQVPVNSFGTFSGSATAAFTDPGSGRTGIITVESQETSAATASSFDVDLTTGGSVDGVGAEWGGSADVVENYTLSFTLPTTAVMQLTGFDNLIDGAPFTAWLSGPSNFYFPIFGSVDDLLTLDPGDYQLVSQSVCVTSPGPSQVGQQICPGELSLHADFAGPAVPEPWSAPVILVVLAAVIAARRRVAAHSTKAPAA